MDNKYLKLTQILSARELQVSNYLVGFRSHKEIADELCMAASTCRKHASNIYDKVGVKNRRSFRAEYAQLSQYLALKNGYPNQSERPKSDQKLSWNDHNDFEHYYLEFSHVLQSMYQGNFDVRLNENGDKNSFKDFIANGINTVNEELDREYMDTKSIIDILNAFKLKNRILVLSKDGQTVQHIFVLSDAIIIRPEYVKGRRISELFSNFNPEKQKSFVRLNPKIFLSHVPSNAIVEVMKSRKMTIYTATICPEEKFEQLVPRILSFIATFGEQETDSPTVLKTAIGNAMSIEAKALYKELKDYILSYNLDLS